MRWADLDLLGHVNNVTYVDYLQEARVDMLRSHGRRAEGEELTEGVVVVRHEVTYRAPLLFRFRPVKIECWVTEIRAATFTMAYEVYHDDLDDLDGAEGADGAGGGRRVYLRASTLLSPYVFANEMPRRLTEEERTALTAYLEPAERVRPARFEVPRDDDGHYAVQVRFSDVDVYGHVNNVKYFEYLQESRIRWMAAVTRGLEMPPIHIVVAQTDVDYRRPILLRQEPYDLWTSLGRLGDKSLTLESEICDGDEVLARARVTTVFFDLEAQRSVAPPAQLRERLAEGLTRTC